MISAIMKIFLKFYVNQQINISLILTNLRESEKYRNLIFQNRANIFKFLWRDTNEHCRYFI